MDNLPNNIEDGYEYAVTIVRKNVSDEKDRRDQKPGFFEQIGTTGTGTAYILKGPYGAIKGPNLDNGVVVNYAMFESLLKKVQ